MKKYSFLFALGVACAWGGQAHASPSTQWQLDEVSARMHEGMTFRTI
jgi:hypothetical protein